MTITIFTATYNRAYILSKAFESLQKQNYKNFEWLIVDDGSTDHTKELVKIFKETANFPIRYFYQENKGKHIAINTGVSKALGELFFLLDSDDYILDTGLEIIAEYYTKIKSNSQIAAIVSPIVTSNGKKLTHNFFEKEFIGSTFDTYKYKVSGEMAMAFRTKVLLKYPFPSFPKEKFCPESLVWRRISLNYKFYYINRSFYIADYLTDGLSYNYWGNMKKNPKTSILFFSELANYRKVPLNLRFYALENYWIFTRYNTNLSFYEKIKSVPKILSFFVLIRSFFKNKFN